MVSMMRPSVIRVLSELLNVILGVMSLEGRYTHVSSPRRLCRLFWLSHWVTHVGSARRSRALAVVSEGC